MDTVVLNAQSLLFNSHSQLPLLTRRSRTIKPLNYTINMSLQQRIVVPNKHGEKLVGIFHDSGSKDVVVLCHGFRSTKEATSIVNLAAAFENARISSFRFDFSGNGESDGTFQYGHYWKEADDLHAVTQYFRGLNRVVAAIVGHSKGMLICSLINYVTNDIIIVLLLVCSICWFGCKDRNLQSCVVSEIEAEYASFDWHLITH
ncbi:hypothetical protein Ahy_B01g054972 isoform A [Arachis hypogaea]|uniref:Serine aminopeptidase S33 domain-containing protein n=1 Tax=Arachis hypogaea TaxID=3818 RepID=A0A445AUP6_ARAHY|nr:hypothetical protein Ahy_B01g054972 isoform A [Arachis hypogaea]